ncbi:MAG: hypothetical protein ABEH80_11230 [Halobaculum sp.]
MIVTVGRVVVMWLGLTAASLAPVTAVEAAYVGRGISLVQQAAVVAALGVAYWLHRRHPTVRADAVVTFGVTALGVHLGLTRLVAPAVTLTRGSVYPTVRATLFAVAALAVGYAAAVTLVDAGGPREALVAVAGSNRDSEEKVD